MVEAAAASPGCKWLLRVDDGYGIKLSIESFTVRNFQRKQDFQLFELYWQFLNQKAERPEVLALCSIYSHLPPNSEHVCHSLIDRLRDRLADGV